MNTTEIAAIITGFFAVLAAIVTGIYLLRAARVQKDLDKQPSPQTPITITVPPTERAEQPSNSAASITSQSNPSIDAKAPLALPQEPTRRVLPLVSPDRAYEGLSLSELDVEFLTDMNFVLKDGDRFTLDVNPDNHGDSEDEMK